MLLKHEDNVAAQLNAGINASTTSIPLKSGEGALFPTTLSGTTDGAGSAISLSQTGIAAANPTLAAGDIIYNITDGSYAVVLAVNTNDLDTTELKGGSGNTWDSADEWCVNRFVVTLIQYDADGETVLQREKVLINSRSTDTLTADASGRGFDGTTAQAFDADDYVYLFVTATTPDYQSTVISQLIQDVQTLDDLLATKADDTAVVHDTGTETIAGEKTFSTIPILPGSDPTADNEAARKAYVDGAGGRAFGGDGTDGALSISSGTTTLDMSNAGLFVKNYSSISITGTADLAFSNPSTTGTFIQLYSQGAVTITSSATPAIDCAGMGGGGGAGGAVETAGDNGSLGTAFTTLAVGGIGGTNGNPGDGGVQNTELAAYTDSEAKLGRKCIFLYGGIGGGGGAGGDNNGGSVAVGGDGGDGGAALYIECAGALNATSEIDVSGGDGAAGVKNATNGGSSGGGGGGGANGQGLIIYGSLTADSITWTATGGAGGAGGEGSGGGSDTHGEGGGGAGGEGGAGGAGGDGGISPTAGSAAGGTGAGGGGGGGNRSNGVAGGAGGSAGATVTTAGNSFANQIF